MDEQRQLPPLEYYYTQVSRDSLRTDERLDGVANAAEGFASVATEPVENHQNSNVSTERRVDRACAECVRRKIKVHEATRNWDSW
ncbi:hypothetical protein AnigIFM63604_009616 [Aspergillus niger]|uniref:Uncharacterized protein n=1 Tax=Aspergillus niger TaxID=5061 RepID=A0A9W6AE59_ASPNG|nr:hypothetical protein AnigIFM63604_009616 [Aspergillus niger]